MKERSSTRSAAPAAVSKQENWTCLLPAVASLRRSCSHFQDHLRSAHFECAASGAKRAKSTKCGCGLRVGQKGKRHARSDDGILSSTEVVQRNGDLCALERRQTVPRPRQWRGGEIDTRLGSGRLTGCAEGGLIGGDGGSDEQRLENINRQGEAKRRSERGPTARIATTS